MRNVVQLSVPCNLRLQEIVGSRGGIITEWLSRDREAQARLRIRVQRMRQIPRAQWTRNEFHGLGGGISEIRWTAGNVQFRGLGFYRDGYFVLVIGCTHKQKVYDPHDCLKSAKAHKREVENGQRNTIPFEP